MVDQHLEWMWKAFIILFPLTGSAFQMNVGQMGCVDSINLTAKTFQVQITKWSSKPTLIEWKLESSQWLSQEEFIWEQKRLLMFLYSLLRSKSNFHQNGGNTKHSFHA